MFWSVSLHLFPYLRVILPVHVYILCPEIEGLYMSALSIYRLLIYYVGASRFELQAVFVVT